MSVLGYMRGRAGWSQKVLSEKTGIPSSVIAEVEAGYEPTEEMAHAFGNVFGVPWQVFHCDVNDPPDDCMGVPGAFYISPAPPAGKLCGEYQFIASDPVSGRSIPLYSFHITEDGRFVQLACEFVGDSSVFGKKPGVAFAARGYIQNDRTFVYEQYCDMTKIMPDRNEVFGIIGYLQWKDWPTDAATLSALSCARVFSVESKSTIDVDNTFTFSPPKEGLYTNFLAKILCDNELCFAEFTLRGYSKKMLSVYEALLSRKPKFIDRKVLISERNVVVGGRYGE